MGRHGDRKDLAGEHKYGDLGQLILLIIFMVVWVLDSFVFEFTLLNEYVPLFIRLPLGILFIIFSGLLAAKGLKTVFGEKREKPRVITTGVFSIVRHPIYLASILFYFGMIMFSVSFLAIVVLVFIKLFYHYISKYEEKLLITKFGKEYQDYMKKVPMLIPIKLK
jgi:protein-S-isoprenylcysteine O-methyltransferase Ste14